ncbi:WYL domain-containing protein [Herbiconiux sp.]|uniref:helix-turn-helix transcriptional regulator n=1 Tax=Herbiconiux sp. TaxID=1871186 RepID=UPI0025C5DA0F|nr:WYL domain-containing protein [Herbiconiux sp.]
MKSARLLSLLLLLQTRQCWTTPELAERLEVSRRTVLRDVEALSTAGVPVYAERGRHGGILLLPGARLNASQLEPAELEALSLAGLDGAQQEQLGLATAHAMAERKIAARRAAVSGSESSARPWSAAPGLADLVLVDNAGWLAAESSTTDVAALALELRARTRLSIRYRSSGAARASRRTVDPYGLVSKAGRWYLVADSRGEARLFALDRLVAFKALPEPVQTRSGETLRSVWVALRDGTETPGEFVVTAWVREDRVDLARRILGVRLEVTETDKESRPGWRIVTIRYPELEAVRQLLQFGDHLEVVAPPEARARVAELAADLLHRHSAS